MNSTEIIALLQESPLFRKVRSSLLAAMLMKTTRVKLTPEQVLLAPGKANDYVYIILSGRLRAQVNVDDTRPLALFGQSECVGEMSMFDDNQVTAFVIAATPCELLAISHADVWTILNESLQASHNMLNILAHRMISSNQLLAESVESLHGYEALDYINHTTGIYNRRWLSENIARLIHRHTMTKQPSSFILVKFMNFAQYDTHFGSLGCDQAQRTIAQTLLRCLRPNDMAAHLSEDQFAVFLPHTEEENVRYVIGRLQEEINQTTIVTPGGDALPPVVLAMGAAKVLPNDTLDSLLARTRAAMSETA
ncbi:MAG TPA: GGDEF domain-containing protein [Gallionellaceae bacterium]